MIGNYDHIVAFFGLGNFIALHPLSAGYANENYRLETSTGTFLLRNCLQQTGKLLRYEIALMQVLKSYSFPTAYPIPSKDGNFILEHNQQNLMLYEFKNGHEPRINKRTTAEIGRAMGLLSTVSPHDHLEFKENTLHLDHTLALIDHFAKAKNPLPDIFRFTENYSKKFSDLDREGLPRGIIHGDVFPNNTIYDEQDKLFAIVDFEEACVDYLLLDVGMTINGFCYVNNTLDIDLLRIFLKNYQAIRPLHEHEATLLWDFIQLAAFSMMCWHLRYNLVDTPLKKQEFRVRELMKRVQEMDRHDLQFGSLMKNIQLFK